MFGIIAAACGGVAAASGMDPVVIKVALVIQSIAVGLLGIFAKDSNVTGGVVVQPSK